jgi:hypothetical protein
MSKFKDDGVRKGLGILHKNSAIPALNAAKYLQISFQDPI